MQSCPGMNGRCNQALQSLRNRTCARCPLSPLFMPTPCSQKHSPTTVQLSVNGTQQSLCLGRAWLKCEVSFFLAFLARSFASRAAAAAAALLAPFLAAAALFRASAFFACSV